MISATELEEEIRKLLGNSIEASFPFETVAADLTTLEQAHGLRLSPYGFIVWAVENQGAKSVWKNVLSSKGLSASYADAACKFRDDMPALLVNAHTYVSKVLANVADLKACFRHLEGMTFPYVLYVLFAGSGQQEAVEHYRPEFEEQMRRYPATLDLLPESYRRVGKEYLDADTK